MTSGNFCGYLNAVDRRSYYTLYFVAVFDQPFAGTGSWGRSDDAARGGTTYGTNGYPVPHLGSGVWVSFPSSSTPLAVSVRVGISYVSEANARANLQAENPPATTFETVRQRAHDAWNAALGRIQVGGGTTRQLTIFYTALYHALLHMNLFSDVNGEYRGFDQQTHKVAAPQRAQYANFSGWDVYRSQLQLVTLLDPKIGADMAQSLFNQASQSAGEWDRWTHESGETHVMEGDPSPSAVASIYAFGGTDFDARGAFDSLKRAAETPTAHDLSNDGCNVECVGQRPSLDKWLTIHYIPTQSNAWGGAGETLEDVTADFSLAQLAERLGDHASHDELMARSGYWRNVFNPTPTIAAGRGRGTRGGAPPARAAGAAGAAAVAGVAAVAGAGTVTAAAAPADAPFPGGYIQNRNADGSWPALDPAGSNGFAEGSSAQYTWMIPFDVAGLFDAMGGLDTASARLDAFFHTPDGKLAVTRAGGLHAEMDNEPSTATPWLYNFAGQPGKTQQVLRETMAALWSDTPGGMPGNDDLGAMSAWYVWTAIGLYPETPGRAELLVAAPTFTRVVIHRANGKLITISAPQTNDANIYVQSLQVNGHASSESWLPESFAATGGTLEFVVGPAASAQWGRGESDRPPSFSAGVSKK